jgi:hypothetical protein
MLKKILIAALMLPLLAFGQSYPSPTFNNLTVQGTFTATGNVGLPSLAAQAANTVVGNATNSSASPTAVVIAGCNGAAQALQYTNGGGASAWGCNSNIATSGANANITSLSGLSTPLSVAQGGNGSSTLPPGRLIGVQRFTGSGTYTSTAGATSIIIVAVAGGGGSGGCAAQAAGNGCAGGGGGAGSYAMARFTSGFTGGIAVTVGAAGAGGASGANVGGTGGVTSVGTLVSCPGGVGGNGNTGSAVAAFLNGGAAAAACTVTGGTTLVSVPGSAGMYGAQTVSGSWVVGGTGGSSPMGNGGQGSSMASGSGAGIAAGGNGAGAGGAVSAASGSATGGSAGSIGLVFVYEYQ